MLKTFQGWLTNLGEFFSIDLTLGLGDELSSASNQIKERNQVLRDKKKHFK